MTLSRRDLLAGLGGLAASSALVNFAAASEAGLSPTRRKATGFPRKADFSIEPGYSFINAAYTHPIPLASAAAARKRVESRAIISSKSREASPANPKALFAKLINAKPSEISYIPNTSTGENLVLNGLGITRFDGNVVTDELHFDGALVHLLELKKEGLDLRVVPAKDGRIDLRDMERVVDRKTKLIEVSLVAMYNGFQHDLKAVCDLAHAHGAYVYADFVQAAGAVPIDVKASGVDFAACSSFKWLMGDFGLGFLYAREDVLERAIKRSQWGYHSTADMTGHYGPFDPDTPKGPVSWTTSGTASGMFEVGSIGGSVEATVEASLAYIHSLGVANIQAHRQPLLVKLRAEMPRLGFTPATPPDSTSPIITFATKDGAAADRKLKAAKVNVRVSDYWLRFSPSVYNDMHDIDRALAALA